MFEPLPCQSDDFCFYFDAFYSTMRTILNELQANMRFVILMVIEWKYDEDDKDARMPVELNLKY